MTGLRKIFASLNRMLAGKHVVPIVIGGTISLLIVASALYMSTSAGRSALPSPLTIQAPQVPRVASIVPSPALFEPPPAPLPATAPTARETSGTPSGAGNTAAGYPYGTRRTILVAAPSGTPVTPGGSAIETSGRQAPAPAAANDSSSDDNSRDSGSHDSRSHDRHGG